MKILITGVAGFVGSALARSLAEDGHIIIGIDNLSTGRVENLSDIKKIHFFDIDLTHKASVPFMDNLLEDIDLVYHLAASIGVKLVQEKPKETFRNSTTINDRLFPLFEKHQVKVIFSSTSEVYGETKHSDGSRETDKLEILPIQSLRGGYAASKIFAEFAIKSFTFPSVIVRFFNIIGPAQVEDYGHVVPRFIKCAVNEEDIPIYGDGTQLRSYCDIRDAIEMLKLLLNDEHNGEIYNIGNDENVADLMLLSATISQVTGSNSAPKFIPFEEALGDHFEEIYNRFPNTEKIKKYYKCKYNLEDIIRNIYETNFNSNSAS